MSRLSLDHFHYFSLDYIQLHSVPWASGLHYLSLSPALNSTFQEKLPTGHSFPQLYDSFPFSIFSPLYFPSQGRGITISFNCGKQFFLIDMSQFLMNHKLGNNLLSGFLASFIVIT